jgi:hypothetical protein
MFANWIVFTAESRDAARPEEEFVMQAVIRFRDAQCSLELRSLSLLAR